MVPNDTLMVSGWWSLVLVCLIFSMMSSRSLSLNLMATLSLWCFSYNPWQYFISKMNDIRFWFGRQGRSKRSLQVLWFGLEQWWIVQGWKKLGSRLKPGRQKGISKWKCLFLTFDLRSRLFLLQRNEIIGQILWNLPTMPAAVLCLAAAVNMAAARATGCSCTGPTVAGGFIVVTPVMPRRSLSLMLVML